MKIKILSTKLKFSLIISLVTLSLTSSLAYAGSFDKGNTIATVSIGSGQFFSEDYLIIGAGIGYYVTDGIELGVDVNYWTGGDPSIYEITPKLTYVYDNPSQFKPYLGVFYNRTYIEGLDDSDALGYRVGAFVPVGTKTYIGIGIVNTELQDCRETVLVSCSETYTELTFRISI